MVLNLSTRKNIERKSKKKEKIAKNKNITTKAELM
jgi:hypothetical protein